MTEVTLSADFDSTMALLASELPDITIPNYPRPAGDSDEEEVFFGPLKSDKEKFGKNSFECHRRKTLRVGEVSEQGPYRGDPNNRSIPEEDEDKENRSSINEVNRQKEQSEFVKLPKTPKSVEKRFLEKVFDIEEDDDLGTSFVDVDNDGMFDCSIFTEYSERDLSSMSENISKKWKSRLTKEQSKKLKKSRNQNKQQQQPAICIDELKVTSKLNETLDLLNDDEIGHDVEACPNEANELEQEAEIEKVKKNLNFEDTCTQEKPDPKPEPEIEPRQDQEAFERLPSEEESDLENVNQAQEFEDRAVPIEIDEQNQFVEDEHLSISMTSTTSGTGPRRSSTNSTCSDWFNTTREEMILYEKYGEDYDLVVEKMSHQEKAKLKEEIANSVPKDVRELLGDEIVTNEDDICDQDQRLDDIVEEEEHHLNPEKCKSSSRDVTKTSLANDLSKTSSINDASKSFVNDIIKDNDMSKLSISKVEESPDVSQMSDKIVEHKFLQPTEVDVVIQEKLPPVPLPRTLTPQKMKEEFPEKMTKSEAKLVPERQHRGTFLTPSSSQNVINRSTERRRFFKTPEALKTTPAYLKPTTASQQRASPRKIDAGSPTPQPASCGRSNYLSASPYNPPHQPHRGHPSSIDMAKIVSPVAQYIHNKNVPKLLRNIRAKTTSNLDEELRSIQEFEERERELLEQDESNQNSQTTLPKKRFFKPLPEAEYRSSRVAIEKEVPSTDEPKDLPKKFGTTSSTEAMVIRHLSRERVAREKIQNWPSSPDSREELGGGAVLVRSNAPARESECFNETSMELSIREVKKIKKLTSSVSRKFLY